MLVVGFEVKVIHTVGGGVCVGPPSIFVDEGCSDDLFLE
jgi:hypothetical protein